MQLVGTSPGSGNLAEGIATLLLAASIALGIAAGATLGTDPGVRSWGSSGASGGDMAAPTMGDDSAFAISATMLPALNAAFQAHSLTRCYEG